MWGRWSLYRKAEIFLVINGRQFPYLVVRFRFVVLVILLKDHTLQSFLKNLTLWWTKVWVSPVMVRSWPFFFLSRLSTVNPGMFSCLCKPCHRCCYGQQIPRHASVGVRGVQRSGNSDSGVREMRRTSFQTNLSPVLLCRTICSCISEMTRRKYKKTFPSVIVEHNCE